MCAAPSLKLDLSPESLAAANINPATGLATDYLNHFNEAAMLLDVMSDMPEAAEELIAWRPRTYAEHFTLTGFRAKDLAIAAFEAADPMVRASFEAACAACDAQMGMVQSLLECGPLEAEDAAALAAELYGLISAVDAVVHGRAGDSANQDAVDALFD